MAEAVMSTNMMTQTADELVSASGSCAPEGVRNGLNSKLPSNLQAGACSAHFIAFRAPPAHAATQLRNVNAVRLAKTCLHLAAHL